MRQRIDHMPFDGPFQVSCAVALVRTLLQKEISTIRGHSEKKLSLSGIQDALLHLTQLDIQHFLELFTPQRMENNHFVEPVHKFGREFPPCRFHGCALHLFVQASDRLVLRLNKAHATFHELCNLTASQIGSEEDHSLREIHLPVVAQS